MPELQRSRYCKNCGRNTLHVRPHFSGGMGCLLMVVTAGLFGPIWLVIWLLEQMRPMRCQQCGRSTYR